MPLQDEERLFIEAMRDLNNQASKLQAEEKASAPVSVPSTGTCTTAVTSSTGLNTSVKRVDSHNSKMSYTSEESSVDGTDVCVYVDTGAGGHAEAGSSLGIGGTGSTDARSLDRLAEATLTVLEVAQKLQRNSSHSLTAHACSVSGSSDKSNLRSSCAYAADQEANQSGKRSAAEAGLIIKQ